MSFSMVHALVDTMLIFLLVRVDVCAGKVASTGLLLKGNAAEPPILALGTTSITYEGGALNFKNAGSTASISPGMTTAQVLNIGGNASLMSITAGGQAQFALFDHDSFDAVDSNQWSMNDHSFCGASRDLFLGGHCRFAATTTSRTYANLPAHSKIKVTARVHYFDQWEGESIVMAAENKPVWSQDHHWCPEFLKWMCRKYGMDSCGRDEPDRLSVKAEATFVHNAPTLTLAFSSSLPQGTDPCYTSWGVDDVAVHVL
jgi:hypothetical protein